MLGDGLYKVSFRTPLGMGYGVLVLADGLAQGGDATMYYRGTYEQEGDDFTASINIGTHTNLPGHGSVFGVPQAHIDLSGKSSDDSASVKGSSPQAPGVGFSAELHLIKG